MAIPSGDVSTGSPATPLAAMVETSAPTTGCALTESMTRRRRVCATRAAGTRPAARSVTQARHTTRPYAALAIFGGSDLRAATLPSGNERMFHPQMIEHPRYHEIYQLGDGPGPVIEPRRRGEHHRPRARDAQHFLEMERVERRVARHQHERPPLLERHVGRALHERARRPRRDGGERPHLAGADHHARTPGRARRRRSAAVGVVVGRDERVERLRADGRAKALHVLDIRLRAEQPEPVRRDDQRHAPLGPDELLEQPDSVRRARCARERHHDRRVRRARGAHASSRSARTKAKSTMLITPFIVKKAASSFDWSSALTSECSYARSASTAATPAP